VCRFTRYLRASTNIDITIIQLIDHILPLPDKLSSLFKSTRFVLFVLKVERLSIKFLCKYFWLNFFMECVAEWVIYEWTFLPTLFKGYISNIIRLYIMIVSFSCRFHLKLQKVQWTFCLKKVISRSCLDYRGITNLGD